MPDPLPAASLLLPDLSHYALELDLRMDDPQWGEPLSETEIRTLIVTILAHLQHPALGKTYECCLIFTEDAVIAPINLQWRKQNKPTNVLSFPACFTAPGVHDPAMPISHYIHLGDIVLARETILREAAEKSIPIAEYLTHMIVHGVLHLLGYDHENDADAEQMESLENQLMERLGYAPPYQPQE
jgi:probable rRNA maturation factor